MSRGPPPAGQQPEQSRDGVQYQQGPFQSPAQQRARNPYFRDPDTGRFLTDQEAAYVEQLARQYPQQVEHAYTQNVSFAAVGLPVPSNLGDMGTQTGPQPQPPQPQQSQQFPQQQQGYQQQPAPVDQQPVQGGQYQQSEQYRQPPQQQVPEQPSGQSTMVGEQAMQNQPRGGQPVQRAPTGQSQQVSSQQPGRSGDQSQESHSAGGVNIPVERGGSGQAAQVPLRETDQRSRQRNRQRRWFWWYNW